MSRRPKLVTQFIERLDRDAFDDHPELIRDLVGNRNGIYALYRKDRLYYVGLATDLRKRLKKHLKNRHAKSWDRFSVYLTIGDQHLRELESLAMRITKTIGNSQIGRFAGAENLAKVFEQKLEQKNRREIDRLMGRVQRSVSEAKGSTNSIKLRARYNGKIIKARMLKNGNVRVKAGKLCSSLSAAAKSVCGHSVNGRRFWQYERSPGDWIAIQKLLGKRGA